MEKITRREFLHLIGAGTALAAFPLGCGQQNSSPLTGLKVLIIGIDGATFDIIDPMLAGEVAEF